MKHKFGIIGYGAMGTYHHQTIEKPEGTRYPLSTRVILQYALDIDRGQRRLQDQQRVAEIMRTLGFQLEKGSAHRISGFPGTHRVWLRVTPPPGKPEEDDK